MILFLKIFAVLLLWVLASLPVAIAIGKVLKKGDE